MGKVKIIGLKELERDLLKLGNGLGSKALTQGLKAASKPMLDKAKQNAASIKDSGAMAASMSMSAKKGTGFRGSKKAAKVRIGPNPKSKRALALWNAEHNLEKPVTRLRHFHIVEYGSKRTPALAVMRRAFASTAKIVLNNFIPEVKKAIKKVVK